MNYLGMILENALPRTSTGSYNNFKFKNYMYSRTHKIVENEDVICLTLLQYERLNDKNMMATSFPKGFFQSPH